MSLKFGKETNAENNVKMFRKKNVNIKFVVTHNIKYIFLAI